MTCRSNSILNSKTIAIISLILLCGNLYAQRITVEGKISAGENIDVEGINILNLSTVK